MALYHSVVNAVVAFCDRLLLPRGVGAQPWGNARFRAVTMQQDNVAFVCMLANNALGFFAVRKFPPARARKGNPRYLNPLGYISAGVLQLVAARRQPNAYFRYRHYLVILLRLLRFVTLARVPIWVRSWLSAVSGVQDATVYDGTHTAATKPVIAVACLLAISGSMHTLMHVAAVPLPLVPQIAFQLLYFTVLVVFHLEPAAACLDTTAFMPQLRGICNGLNTVLVVLYSSGDGMHMHLPQLDEACHANTARVMVLFVHLYTVLVLPLYYAYRLEQECRHRMLLAPPGRRDAGGGAVAGQGALQDDPVWVPLHDCVALLLVGMLCWVATLAAQPYLPLLVQPLAAPLPRAPA